MHPPGDNKGPGLLLATDRRPDESTDRREELAALENAINELPEVLKNVFILTALEKRQQGEVQELLGYLAQGGRDEALSSSQTAFGQDG
jgi:hypothetical protein